MIATGAPLLRGAEGGPGAHRYLEGSQVAIQKQVILAITIEVGTVGLVFRVRSRGDPEVRGPGGGATRPGVRSAVVDDHFSGGSVGDPFVKAIAIHIAGDGLVPVFIVVLGVPGTRPEGTIGGEGLSVVVVTGIETTGAGEVQGDVRVRVVVDQPIAVVVAIVDVLGVGGVDAVGEVIAVAVFGGPTILIDIVVHDAIAIVVHTIVQLGMTRVHAIAGIIAIALIFRVSVPVIIVAAGTFIDRAITIVVDTIFQFRVTRIDSVGQVVAVAFESGEAVPVVVRGGASV